MSRQRSVRFLATNLLAIAGLGATFIAAPSAVASTPDCPAAGSGISYCFNAPPPTDANRADNNAIENKIDALIATAGKGQTVRVSIYLLDSAPIVDALIGAFNSGAAVKVIADRSGSESANKHGANFERLFDTINSVSSTTDWTTYEANPTSASYVALCPNSCISGKSINHQKFVMVGNSTSGTVIVTSSNFLDEGTTGSTNSGDNAWNNAVEFKSKAAYGDFDTEFTLQKKGWEHFGLKMKGSKKPTDPSGSSALGGGDELLFYPREKLTTNPALPLLGAGAHVTDADCSGKNPTTINVAMDILSDSTVADRLRALSVEGCKVTVVVTYHSGDAKALKTLESCPVSHRSKAVVYLLKHAPGLVHSKYMVITGKYDNGTTPLVYTGTLNFDPNAYQHADNTEVLLRGSSASTPFNANFAQILAAAKTQKGKAKQGKFGLQTNAKCS